MQPVKSELLHTLMYIFLNPFFFLVLDRERDIGGNKIPTKALTLSHYPELNMFFWNWALKQLYPDLTPPNPKRHTFLHLLDLMFTSRAASMQCAGHAGKLQ